MGDNIENAEHEISKKTELRAETQQSKAESEGEKSQITTDRDEDQKYLDDMIGLCKMKKNDFEARAQLRGEEIEAIQKAVEIISGSSVKGAGEEHLPTLLQLRRKRRAVALVQLRGRGQDQGESYISPVQGRIAQFLAEKSQQY